MSAYSQNTNAVRKRDRKAEVQRAISREARRVSRRRAQLKRAHA